MGKAASLLCVVEQWRYGGSKDTAPASVGSVYFDKRGLVRAVCGKGTAVSEGILDEQTLRAVFAVLSQVPSYNDSGEHFDARKVIRAVNTLQPLGKARALAAIEEFLRVTPAHDPAREGIFLVLRALFEVPSNLDNMPTMYVGQPYPMPPADRTLSPRFPLVLEGDVPFHLVVSFGLFGVPEVPERHCASFRRDGVIRDRPLVPTNDPIGALDLFMQSSRWRFVDRHGQMNNRVLADRNLRRQLLRLLDTVIYTERDRNGAFVLPDEYALNELFDRIRGQDLKWDASRAIYTFADGTVLPTTQTLGNKLRCEHDVASAWGAPLLRGTLAPGFPITMTCGLEHGEPRGRVGLSSIGVRRWAGWRWK